MAQSDIGPEAELFFKQWLRSPKSMGSIIPSSRHLARAIAKEVVCDNDQWIVELGGGTGAITQGLIEHGFPRERLAVIELDGSLATYLKDRLPGCCVIQGDATRLDEILPHYGIGEIGTVVSGLPMVGMPFEFQRAIIDQGFKTVRNGGFMLQYSYSPVPPVPAKKLGLEAKIARFVFLNLPPAYVWKYTREA